MNERDSRVEMCEIQLLCEVSAYRNNNSDKKENLKGNLTGIPFENEVNIEPLMLELSYFIGSQP